MKKLYLIACTIIFLLLGNVSAYSVPSVADLGNPTGEIQTFYFLNGGSLGRMHIIGFQFGILIKGLGGGDIIYLYGQGDLPWYTKSSNGIITSNEKVNLDDNIYINVFEASNISNPVSIQQKIVNGNVSDNLQSLNLENGKLYIIIYRDKSEDVLDVKKIMFTE